jgi:predicted nucleic acid-binding protein
MYLADTNVYIDATHDAGFRERFENFILREGPLPVSAVVAAEVLIGVADPRHHAAAVRALAAGTTIVTPQADDWMVAAGAVVRLGGDAVTKSRSFWNDAVLAAQCARLGLTLITHNADDFRRLARSITVRARTPFP